MNVYCVYAASVKGRNFPMSSIYAHLTEVYFVHSDILGNFCCRLCNGNHRRTLAVTLQVLSLMSRCVFTICFLFQHKQIKPWCHVLNKE